MRQTRQTGSKTTIANYIGGVSKTPRLTHEQTVELFKKLHAGDKSARKKLIESNLRLVISIAKKYANVVRSNNGCRERELMLEDLMQEGNCGLMRAIEKFKWEKGFRFGTYATWWIRQAIQQYVFNEKRLVRMPAHAVALQRKMIQAGDKYRDENDAEPSAEELLEITKGSKIVMDATIQSSRGCISLSSGFDKNDDSQKTRQLLDFLKDDSAMGNPAGQIERVCDHQAALRTRRGPR
jgi:RNA polymerase sigma factor (sigma-70 family)